MNTSRRDALKLIGAAGLTLALARVCEVLSSVGEQIPPPSRIANLLPDYFNNTRQNVVVHGGQRALLSSHFYPQATYVRDAFYGPLALNDAGLSEECYRWFARTSDRATGQIRTAVPFDPNDDPQFPAQDDDSSLLFVIWSMWLKRQRVAVDQSVVERAFAFIEAHVRADQFISPAGAFRYWADTVQFDTAERITHNQGLYVVAVRAMIELGWGSVTRQDYANARSRYAAFYRPSLGALTLGQDSWWADKLDISALFPEFLLRWLFDESALPDDMIRSTIDRFRQTASVTKDNAIVGIKTICAPDGSFLPREKYFAPGLNWPGDYQNGGYWPMYTLIALALSYKIASQPAIKQLIEDLVTLELATDHRSKEVIILAPEAIGTVNPDRSGYTWNALIVPALQWAGVI